MSSGRKIEDWFDRRIKTAGELDKLQEDVKEGISSRLKLPVKAVEKVEEEVKESIVHEMETIETKASGTPHTRPSVKKVRVFSLGEKLSGLTKKLPVPDVKGQLQEKREVAAKTRESLEEGRYSKIRTGSLSDWVVENPKTTLTIMSLITIFLFFQAVHIDTSKTIPLGNNLNIHGQTTDYLPKNHETSKIVEEVRKYWSTDIVVVFVQINDPDQNKVNITNPAVLREMSYVEEYMDPDKSDRGTVDGIVYCLSISSLIKEVNSTAPRLYNATIKNLAEFISQMTGAPVDEAQVTKYVNIDPVGNYSIPNSQNQIDTIVNNLPENVRNKLVRDTNGDGIWDTAVMIMGMNEHANPKKIISISESAVDTRPRQGNITTMTVTGTVPLTDYITDKAFYYYGILMPVAIVLLVAAIMWFHRSFKTVLIAGIPTGAAVIWIYGALAMFDIVVTPTIIILGPVLLALGMSYGLHIANRFAQETDPSFTERARITLKTTGSAVLMSAVTTMVGFFSLAFGDLKPVTTVGWSLTIGIGFAFLLTYFMSPALCILTKFEKKTLKKQGKSWGKIAKIPTNHSKTIIIATVILIIFSVSLIPFIQKDTDLLAMAPNRDTELWGSKITGIEKVKVMKTYSEEFDSGATGMVLVRGQLRSDNYMDDSQDPMANLKQIERIENDINAIPDQHPDLPVNAIGLVSVLKAIGGKGNISTSQIPVIGSLFPADINLSQSSSFWGVLNSPGVANFKPLQKFLLNVFYDSLSNESKGMVINEYREGYPEYYSKTLIYVDMPVLSDKKTHEAVGLVDDITQKNPHGDLRVTKLTGVAAVAVAVNDMLMVQQKISLVLSIILVAIVLSIIFKSWKLGLITTTPVVMVIGFEPLVMVGLNVPLNLATVMIGSSVIGAGVDFSVHITERMTEKGLNIPAIENSVHKAGPALFEATTITLAGLSAAFLIPVPALYNFIAVIMILLALSAVAALFILPAIYTIYVQILASKKALKEETEGREEEDWDVEWEV